LKHFKENDNNIQKLKNKTIFNENNINKPIIYLTFNHFKPFIYGRGEACRLFISNFNPFLEVHGGKFKGSVPKIRHNAQHGTYDRSKYLTDKNLKEYIECLQLFDDINYQKLFVSFCHFIYHETINDNIFSLSNFNQNIHLILQIGDEPFFDEFIKDLKIIFGINLENLYSSKKVFFIIIKFLITLNKKLNFLNIFQEKLISILFSPFYINQYVNKILFFNLMSTSLDNYLMSTSLDNYFYEKLNKKFNNFNFIDILLLDEPYYFKKIIENKNRNQNINKNLKINKINNNDKKKKDLLVLFVLIIKKTFKQYSSNIAITAFLYCSINSENDRHKTYFNTIIKIFLKSFNEELFRTSIIVNNDNYYLDNFIDDYSTIIQNKNKNKIKNKQDFKNKIIKSLEEIIDDTFNHFNICFDIVIFFYRLSTYIMFFNLNPQEIEKKMKKLEKNQNQ